MYAGISAYVRVTFIYRRVFRQFKLRKIVFADEAVGVDSDYSGRT